MLLKIFGSNRDEITGEYKRLCNEELYQMYPGQILLGSSNHRNEKGGHVAGMGDRRQAYRVLVGRPEEKRYHLESLGI